MGSKYFFMLSTVLKTERNARNMDQYRKTILSFLFHVTERKSESDWLDKSKTDYEEEEYKEFLEKETNYQQTQVSTVLRSFTLNFWHGNLIYFKLFSYN